MPNKMLIDTDHPEETRVVVVRGSRVEEFDYESATRKQLRGNIYLAKVIRIEPSLQAAFVEYGGNRHGFLAFSEIHPDYYQIPVADRQALIEAEEQESKAFSNGGADAAETSDDEPAKQADDTDSDADPVADEEASTESVDGGNNDQASNGDGGSGEESVESVGAEDALEELPVRRRTRARHYKIQEVIRRRQVLLVQVVKEERGNKGAALTTYLSLAGRYSVLMPNTNRGGGISRKITTPADRKRLKAVATDLDVPQGMGVILRTAGASRTKAEIKRDFEYLLRLWESVRELTLRSSAPSLVYEEGSLIKRAIRDLYGRDVNEILVAGEGGYREAKDFMRMLMPSHAKNVQPYRDSQPLFAKFGVEAQLDVMFLPQVSLPAGGYIVINQTEALVSIDVNSGRSTREHSIEDTALQTNLQAAEEVARQLRLRDLAGLVVVDFIDMEERRNNRSVERRIKDFLKDDRARIQVGRISHFGLLEMSRQRIRTGVLESTSEICQHCVGTGHVRSAASVALHVLRSLEDHLLKGVTHHLNVRTRTNVALYILNQKRANLSELEQRFGLFINIVADETVTSAAHFVLDRGDPIEARSAVPTSIQPTSVQPDHAVEAAEAETDEADDNTDAERADEQRAEIQERPRKRRRRRRRSEGASEPAKADREPAEDIAVEAAEDEIVDGIAAEVEPSAEVSAEQPRRRRRGRRGGRRSKRASSGTSSAIDTNADTESGVAEAESADAMSRAYEIAKELGSPVMQPNARSDAERDDVGPVDGGPESGAAEVEPKAAAAPNRSHGAKERILDETEPPTESGAANGDDAEQPPPKAARRAGWWQRRSFF